MMKKVFILLFLTIISFANAQHKKDRVLFTVNNEPVYQSEFLRVYNKNKDIVSEENKKNIDEYLDLFINYKLKLKQAYDMKLDTVPSYVKEFNKYKKQLIEPYLKDRKVTEKLVKEAYERTKYEVKAKHILVMLNTNATPQDTLKAYNKILKAREEVLSGKPFEEVAKKYSEDPSVKENGGKLGYFTAFSMVYPFESAVYNTKVGEISMPFRTQFGFHIVGVDDKKLSKGEVQVAHIMIKEKKDEPNYAKKQAEDIYNKFKQGDTFESLAKQYSDDKMTASKGGILRKFSYGRMLPSFADVSFNLKEVGDVSKPFKTKFGWHIVKLIKKFPIGTYDELKDALTKKVEKGDRSVLVGKSIANRLKKEYGVVVNKANLDEFLKDRKNDSINEKIILTIKKTSYNVKDLKDYLAKSTRNTYTKFIDDMVIDYYKEHLADNNPDFASTLKEYKDGLLLFDLLQKKIWTKAEKDTIGLQNFFNKNANKYNWKKRVDADIASCTKLEKAKEVQKLLNQGKTVDEIKNLVNEGATIHVLFTSGTYEFDSSRLPKGIEIKKGVSKIVENKKNDFKIVRIKEVLEEAPKKLDETKGKVISDYQDYLEKEWIKNLHKTYTVEVNKKTLKKLKKRYKK